MWERWIADIRNCAGDALLITGDISEGDDVVFELRRLVETLDQEIYFVLGNHDFYQSSIGLTRQRVIGLCREDPRLHFLTDSQPIEISSNVYLVGDDGWGDATQGDYCGSPVRLNDFQLIEDFRTAAPEKWQEMLRYQGQASAERLAQKLFDIPMGTAQVLVLTHVPPFRESCWYQGHTTDDWWAPFFVCGAIGDVLKRFAEARPETKLTTLCGHTHHAGMATMAANHTVYTGAATYGEPTVEATVTTVGGTLQLAIV